MPAYTWENASFGSLSATGPVTLLDNTGNPNLGLLFGSPADTQFYRRTAFTLRTNGFLEAAGSITGSAGIAEQASIGAVGPAAQAGLVLGSAFDTNLYRSAANTLTTDDNFGSTIGRIIACSTLTSRTGIGDLGPAAEPALLFGNTGDVNLYRSGADRLGTDDMLDLSTAGTGTAAANAGSVLGDKISLYSTSSAVRYGLGAQTNTLVMYGRNSAGSKLSIRTAGAGATGSNGAEVASIAFDTGKIASNGEIQIGGDLNHDGTNVGFYGKAPVPIAADPGQPAATAATNVTPYGYSQAQADALITTVRAMYTALKNIGILT